MELFIFARVHAREGQEGAVEAAMREVRGPTSREPGCLALQYHRSIRDPRLFYIHSRWIDEPAFETHAGLPHTVRFIERMGELTDQPMEVARTRPID